MNQDRRRRRFPRLERFLFWVAAAIGTDAAIRHLRQVPQALTWTDWGDAAVLGVIVYVATALALAWVYSVVTLLFSPH